MNNGIDMTSATHSSANQIHNLKALSGSRCTPIPREVRLLYRNPSTLQSLHVDLCLKHLEDACRQIILKLLLCCRGALTHGFML